MEHGKRRLRAEVLDEWLGILWASFKGTGGFGNFPCESSLMAEAEAVRAALLVCLEKGFLEVQVESDSTCVVGMTNGAIQPGASLEGLFFVIRSLQKQLKLIEILFTPNVCNKAAHLGASFVSR